MNETNKSKLLGKLRYFPLVIMGIIFMFFLLNYKRISVERILNFTPSNYFLAAFIIILFFAIKSLSVVIPLTALYVTSSIIFPWYWAILVNILGLFVTMTIPYYIGKFSGKKLVDGLIIKYPKVNKINDVKANNQWLFVFLVKILGFIPNDISSIMLGSFNTDYKIFVITSILVRIPGMLAKTLLGANISQPWSMGFNIAIIIGILFVIFTMFVYWRNRDTIKPNTNKKKIHLDMKK